MRRPVAQAAGAPSRPSNAATSASTMNAPSGGAAIRSTDPSASSVRSNDRNAQQHDSAATIASRRRATRGSPAKRRMATGPWGSTETSASRPRAAISRRRPGISSGESAQAMGVSMAGTVHLEPHFMSSAAMDQTTLSIGEVARRAGLATSAIRYYERAGVLPPAERVGGRRRYGPEAVRRLAVIGIAQQAGFTLAE